MLLRFTLPCASGLRDGDFFTLYMKSRSAFISGFAIIVVAAFAIWSKLNSQSGASQYHYIPIPQSVTATRASAFSHGGKSSVEVREVIPIHENPSGRVAHESVEQILGEIHDASITYDPHELSKIGPYLRHENPSVRAAAVDGMIVLGDASAGVMLREAAKVTTSSQEVIAMLQAADYVELPSATDVLRIKRQAAENKHLGTP